MGATQPQSCKLSDESTHSWRGGHVTYISTIKESHSLGHNDLLRNQPITAKQRSKLTLGLFLEPHTHTYTQLLLFNAKPGRI